ncbi:hypothetical protein HNV11_05750 [Spirosoma taeanense]|uniref:Uncharacterized protein n=1 Tax=Spirosoma taeanense TaxID=2735870 RepID=A0A6M5Y6T5_9BACT|nr:hypothetical protein [Spirosoma taeanense]QJW88921.1 hypothetical protein HNV11_05750 [Spirosoma taeanense]
MKSRVIFASLVLGLGLMTIQANAATTTNTDDSPAANKPANALLINGSEKQFALFFEQRLNKFTHNTNWQNFMSVVSLYNQKPAAVLNLSPADRVKFNEAAAQVNTQLARQKGAEANRWMNQAHFTTRMINFLWDSSKSISEVSDVQ